jgi:hypothetical protein
MSISLEISVGAIPVAKLSVTRYAAGHGGQARGRPGPRIRTSPARLIGARYLWSGLG